MHLGCCIANAQQTATIMEESSGIRVRLQRSQDGFTFLESSVPTPSKRIKTDSSEEDHPIDEESIAFEDVVLPDIPETAELPPMQPMQSVLFNASLGIKDADPSTALPYTGPMLVGFRPEAANYPVLIPSYSSWFDVDKVHQNEIRALPEFFHADKPQDAEKYKVGFKVF
jgi:hypothetical protein